MMWRSLFLVLSLAAVQLRADTHALIVVGLAGESGQWETYRAETSGWEKLLATNGVAKDRLRIIRTPENKAEAKGESTRDAVKAHLAAWSKNLRDTDDAILVLIGYGVTQNGQYQFQVRGPRLTSKDFCDGVRGLPARSLTVFITGPGGTGLAEALAAPKRTILSATAAETEINQTRFGSCWLEAAGANPAAPLLDILRATDQKVAAAYDNQHLARSEHAQLRIGTAAPVEAPFDTPLDKETLQKWTLAYPALTTPLTASAQPPATPAPSSPEPPIEIPRTPPPDIEKESSSLLRTRPSTPEEKALLAGAPKAADYPNDSGVILLKSVQSEVAADFSSREIREYRIAVFDMRARRLLDRRLIPHSPRGHVRLLRLKTIAPSGQTIEVQADEVNRPPDLKANRAPESVPVFAPGVVPGCVVEYAYEISLPRPPFSAYFDELDLAEEAPIRELAVKLTTDLKTPMKLKLDAPPSSESKTEASPHATTQTWKWRDLPAFIDEPNTPLADRKEPRLLVTSYKDWKEFVEWFRRISRGTTKSSDTIREAARAVTAGAKDDNGKICALYDYVSSLRYVAIEIGANAFRPHTANTVLARQYGDCKDKANLLIALLREAGIPAEFALVARGRPFDEDFPGFQFNHAVAVVRRPDGLRWLDATDEACPFGMVPPGDAGQRALVFAENTEKFETINAFAPGYDATTKCTLDLEMAADGSAAKGTVFLQPRGLEDYLWRSLLRHQALSAVQREIIHRCRLAWLGARVEMAEFTGGRSLSEPLAIKLPVSMPLYDERAGGFRMPAPWLRIASQLDTAKRRDPQELNGGYPVRFEQVGTVKLPTPLRKTLVTEGKTTLSGGPFSSKPPNHQWSVDVSTDSHLVTVTGRIDWETPVTGPVPPDWLDEWTRNLQTFIPWPPPPKKP